MRLLSALCSVVCVRVSSSSAAAVASCCNSSESLQSDWGRFLYDQKSLCEHWTTVLETLTVINCCIFSLNSTDAQSEGSPASTATKPSWSSWYTCAHRIYEELWRLSRFLLIPAHTIIPITISVNSLVDITGESDSGSWSKCHCWRLSHSHLSAASCTQKQILHLSAERKQRKGSTSCWKCCWVNEPVKQQQASVHMRMVMRVMLLVLSAVLTDTCESCSLQLTGL